MLSERALTNSPQEQSVSETNAVEWAREKKCQYNDVFPLFWEKWRDANSSLGFKVISLATALRCISAKFSLYTQ